MIPKPDVAWHPVTVRVADYSPNETGYKLRPENYEQVIRYALEMEGGTIFPLIKIANVRGKMHVVDGYHRLAAARHLKRETIEAHVGKMTASIARSWAIDANASNGLPLTSADRKPIFAMYMKGKLHLRDDGTVKAGRTIAKELSSSLGTLLSPATVRAWMSDYENTGFKYDPERPTSRGSHFSDYSSHDDDKIDEVNTSLAFVKRLYWEVEDDAFRKRIKQLLNSMVSDIDTPPYSENDLDDDSDTLDI